MYLNHVPEKGQRDNALGIFINLVMMVCGILVLIHAGKVKHRYRSQTRP